MKKRLFQKANISLPSRREWCLQFPQLIPQCQFFCWTILFPEEKFCRNTMSRRQKKKRLQSILFVWDIVWMFHKILRINQNKCMIKVKGISFRSWVNQCIQNIRRLWNSRKDLVLHWHTIEINGLLWAISWYR